MRRPASAFLIAGAFAVLALAALPAAANPINSPVQYSVKFVCGFLPPQPPGEEGPVKPGNYATAVNVHNPTLIPNIPVAVRVNLHYSGGSPPPPTPAPVTRPAYRFRTLEIDCPDIWIIAGMMPGTFVKGMLHLGTPQELPIAAVYTSQTFLGPGTALDPGAGMSIDVEYIQPFFVQP